MWIVIKSDNYRLPQPFLLEEYKYKMLFIPLVMVNKWDWQYFSLPIKRLQYSPNYYSVLVR